MINYRATLALIGISMFVVLGQWPGQAAAEVNIDIGGVLRDKFRWLRARQTPGRPGNE
jgi:hypothetical protein